MLLKLAKIDQKWNFSTFLKSLIFLLYSFLKTVCCVFYDLKNMKIEKKSLKISQFLPHFMNLNHILKKMVEQGPGTYFQFGFFLNVHALGYLKSETKKFCEHFWVNKSLSMMCSLSRNDDAGKPIMIMAQWVAYNFRI
jgi:hypothetical protein